MKKLLCLGFICLAVVSGVRAQSYSIDWYTIDGGGGTSSGGGYSVSGTIGQPDAGRMSGGNYTIEGGFWAIYSAVQTPGAPTLRVTLTTTNTVVVSWPTTASTYNLQQVSDLSLTNWVAVPNVPVVVGTEKQVIVSPPSGNRYFRLISP